jgi:hypothetical protein
VKDGSASVNKDIIDGTGAGKIVAIGVGVVENVGVEVGAVVGVPVGVGDGFGIELGVGLIVEVGVGVEAIVNINELLFPTRLRSATSKVTSELPVATLIEVDPTPAEKSLIVLGVMVPAEHIKEGVPV